MISVIVPFYNSSQHLRQCIDSITNQSYKDVEILLIDDGSTDNSVEICQEYASKYSNIIIYNNPHNMGIYLTRIKAIKLARGEYITFVDSDDWLEKDALKQLLDAAKDNNAEIVQMRHRKSFAKVNISVACSQYSCYSVGTILKPTLQQEYIKAFLGEDNIIPVFPWGKLYLATLLKSIDFPHLENVWGDDQIINLLIFHYAKSFVSINYTGYNYRWGGFSDTPKIGDIKKYNNLFSAISKIAISLGYESYLDNLKEQNERIFRYYIRHCITTFSLPKEEIIDIIIHRTHNESIAQKIYSKEKRNTIKYFYKNIIRRIIS